MPGFSALFEVRQIGPSGLTGLVWEGSTRKKVQRERKNYTARPPKTCIFKGFRRHAVCHTPGAWPA